MWDAQYTTFRDLAEGPEWDGLDDGGNIPPTQEPEITKEPQMGFGYKTGDGTKKEFPNPTETDEIPF
jgi:hypothetical protein